MECGNYLHGDGRVLVTRCQYYKNFANEDDCPEPATHRAEYAGETFRVCAEHAEATVPCWESIEPLTEPPKTATAPKPEDKARFKSYFAARDAIRKHIDFAKSTRVTVADITILWWFIDNAHYPSAKGYGWVTDSCTTEQVVHEMTGLSFRTIERSKRRLEAEGWITRDGQRVSVKNFLDLVYGLQ